MCKTCRQESYCCLCRVEQYAVFIGNEGSICTVKVDTFKCTAAAECRCRNFTYRCRQVNILQSFATAECSVGQSKDCRFQCSRCQLLSLIEQICANMSYCSWDDDFAEICVSECRSANLCDRSRDFKFFQSGFFEYGVTDFCALAVRSKCNLLQRCKTVEQTCVVFVNRCVFGISAFKHGDICRDFEGLQCNASVECVSGQHFKLRIVTECNACQLVTVQECLFSDCLQCCRKNNGCE